VGGVGDRSFDHAAFDRGRDCEVRCLQIIVIGADIADVREGEGDDLASIGGVGEDLLVAGHGGIKADLAHGFAFCTEALAFNDGAIGKYEQAGHARRFPIAELGAWFCFGLFGAGHRGISGIWRCMVERGLGVKVAAHGDWDYSAGFPTGMSSMSLRAKINDDLKAAMKAGDKRKVSALRLMNAAIKDKDINSRTDGHDSMLTADAGLIDLFAKMVKQRQESLGMYEQGGRPELAQQE